MFIEEESDHCEYLVAGKISSPSCRELGIPHDERQPISCSQTRNASTDIGNQKVTTCGTAFPVTTKCFSTIDPFSPFCMIPLPSPFGAGLFDPTCMRRRNERERERVRCVNEGYVKLKEHLPLENKEKRISKVETLRGAIEYINHLQKLLGKDTKYGIEQSMEYSASHGKIHEDDLSTSPDYRHNNKIKCCDSDFKITQYGIKYFRHVPGSDICRQKDSCSDMYECSSHSISTDTDSESDAYYMSSDSADCVSDSECR